MGAGAQGITLTDEACSYLVARIALDLDLRRDFPEIPPTLPQVLGLSDPKTLVLPDLNSLGMFERLVRLDPDADMYFACLASLHRARLKYQSILETQPIPTLEQVGPRALLQYGRISTAGLTGLLFWRKWFFDLDNRAGQETGYLFEPVIANAIGGVPVPAKKSPIKRGGLPNNGGRQVDCLRNKRAYEIKLRVTIAASGQGRWREEMDFPIDCHKSGYVPVLVVLDSTPNQKLEELEARFLAYHGDVYKGAAAWQHLEALAGPTMSRFLETYVKEPLDQLTKHAPEQLPPFAASMDGGSISLSVGTESLVIPRGAGSEELEDVDEMPEDVVDEFPG